MARSLRYLFVLLFIGISGTAFGQAAPGDIKGKVLDEKGEPVLNAQVKVLEGQIVKIGNVTDYDGNYDLKPIDPGTYDVVITYGGYKTSITKGVRVNPDRSTDLNVTLEKLSHDLNTVVITAYKVPLIDKYAGQGNIITGDDIGKMATHTVNEVAATTTGVYQQKRGTDLSLQGARSSGTQYIIDGVVTNGTSGIDLSQGSIDQVEVMTSGLSAKYGDVSGGVINITTKGVSSKLSGDIQAEHSLDGYNHNMLSFNLSSPLYRKKQKDGTKRPVMGFRLGGDYYYDADRYPSYLPTYVAQGSVLNNLTQNPLKIQSDPTGLPVYKYATEFVTDDQLTTVKSPSHNATIEGRLNGKLDFQLTDNMNLTAAGNFNYTKTNNFSQAQILFAPSAIPSTNDYTGRGYIRLTQRFGKSNDTTRSIISNAYYSIQLDYQNEYTLTEDPNFKKNLFDYDYLGKFTPKYQTIYNQQGTDSITGITAVQLVTYQSPDGVTFDRSEMNPALANYTSEYYNTTNVAPLSLADIRSNNALANGDLPQFAYGMFYNVGVGLTGYGYSSNQQYSATIDASFDLQLGKTKHSIEFGLYYQQRYDRSYSASSNPFSAGSQSIWELMRQLTNSHISLDKNNPIFIVNGQRYTKTDLGQVSVSPNDTIVYNSIANTSAQSTFDKNLRKKLGYDVNGTDNINIDGLSPNEFSLGMFSADELLNSGNPFVNYVGYTYTGARQSGNVSFNDFFTQKDANGNYTRPIAAFQPNYIAGYILDKFEFKKDFLFNVGVRIDRYDDNQSVLKDPYSLYEEQTVSSAATAAIPVTGANNLINGGVHPSNIGGNYIVYVDDNGSTNPAIIGYRSGDNWYDATGKLIQDPSVLSATTGRDPQPLLTTAGKVKITDTAFNPTHSFTNYTPQVSVMPRLSFSFPISDVATFYGHYDIYSQRPTYAIQSSPYNYYYLQQNAQSIISNPDLKNQKTFDYEAGFMQKLTEQSSITLSAFYTERKDMIAFRPYLYAYPSTYYTFGNRDFSTTKGMKLKYDLRRINHLKLNISYTLQFAEGTGSTPTSSNAGGSGQVSPNGLLQNFIEAGLPNLRYVSALNIDSRHIINVVADYRYDEGEGPMIGGKHVFENAGVNFIFRARSGEPYTRYVDPDIVDHTIIGGVGGSRLPWHYGVDMKIDKDFALSVGKRHGEKEAGVKPKKMLYLNAYLYVQNLFNTQDILGVYGYTGKPSDMGYLTSSYGKAQIPNQTYPLSYMDLFTINYLNPGAYNLPRTITLGLSLNF